MFSPYDLCETCEEKEIPDWCDSCVRANTTLDFDLERIQDIAIREGKCIYCKSNEANDEMLQTNSYQHEICSEIITGEDWESNVSIEIMLSYFKKGDDLANCLVHRNSAYDPVNSFANHGILLRDSTRILEKLSLYFRRFEIEFPGNASSIHITAGTHVTIINVPTYVARHLCLGGMCYISPSELYSWSDEYKEDKYEEY